MSFDFDFVLFFLLWEKRWKNSPPTGLGWIELVRVQLLISFSDDDEIRPKIIFKKWTDYLFCFLFKKKEKIKREFLKAAADWMSVYIINTTRVLHQCHDTGHVSSQSRPTTHTHRNLDNFFSSSSSSWQLTKEKRKKKKKGNEHNFCIFRVQFVVNALAEEGGNIKEKKSWSISSIMRFAVLHERNLHIEQSSFSQVVQPMCVHVSKKMRNEKRKNIETKDERNGARPFSYHITSSSIHISL